MTMYNGKSYLLRNLLCLTVILLLVISLVFCSVGTLAYADSFDESSSDIEALGLVTKLTIKMGAVDGYVWAEAHNEFTLGFSTIQVYVELYSSNTDQDSYKNMQLESKNFISDLNIGKSIRTTAPINGRQLYWRGRLFYKMDSKDWVSKETITYLVDADGNVIRTA